MDNFSKYKRIIDFVNLVDWCSFIGGSRGWSKERSK